MHIITQIFCLFTLTFLAPLTLAAEQPLRDYPPAKIAAHTYVIHGPLGFPSVENQGFMNNPGFVITRRGVVVIDPGSSVQAGRMVLKQIRNLTKNPVTHVFNTHVHGDHWLGNQAIIEAYPKAKLIGHPEMIKKLQEGEAEQWVNILDKATNGYTQGTQAVPPTIATVDKDKYKIDGINFRIHAPEKAHSYTDIMIEVVEDSVIFTGDNVLNKTIGRMADGTFAGNIAACKQIAARKANFYVPGHGPTGDVGMVTNYQSYLSTLLSSVKQQYELGLADFEMKSVIASKLTPYQSWLRFDVELGPHISHAILEIEASL
jgi:glyoxylase-like metal-dependent hydrolase (beta-lactamase superfamily II)